MPPVVLILLIVFGVLVLFGILPTLVMSSVLYTVLFVRNKPEKWNRECSIPDDEEYKRMFDIGLSWGETYKDRITPVEIKSGKYRLYGEYFDFGFDRAVIIIPGRMEALRYSYYFAEPYREAGYNVLCIDNRSHGESDGRYASLGFKEYRDILNWAAFLHDTYGMKKVILHGICIGSSVALFALTSPDCPEYLAAMTADGMYTTFYESFKNHMKEDKHPNFPFSYGVMFLLWIVAGAHPMTDGPIKRIGKLQKPILFIHSKEDVFSLPEKAQVLYDKCQSEKRLVWFDHGAHSRVRINDPEGYDRAIIGFYRDLDKKEALTAENAEANI